jgi:hypothetical protein
LSQEEKILFKVLQKEIVSAMKCTYPGINPEISEWKGQDITDFQEDLLLKVNGRISEKWFYTHMKGINLSLPRIDVLNILSQYSGYKNWDDFRFKNLEHVPLSEKLKSTNRIFIKVPLILFTTMILLFILYRIINTQNYSFTFFDADTGDAIGNINIQGNLLLENESPVSYTSDSNGKIALRTDLSKIKMVVKAPGYLTDTIVRVLKKFNRTERVGLNVDPYALMIQYFSQTNVKAWQKRREQLDSLINDGAMIYQVPDQKEGTGMELYNKQEFIDKLTMPASSLRHIEILDSRYSHGQIMILRFKVNTNIR